MTHTVISTPNGTTLRNIDIRTGEPGAPVRPFRLASVSVYKFLTNNLVIDVECSGFLSSEAARMFADELVTAAELVEKLKREGECLTK